MVITMISLVMKVNIRLRRRCHIQELDFIDVRITLASVYFIVRDELNMFAETLFLYIVRYFIPSDILDIIILGKSLYQ